MLLDLTKEIQYNVNKNDPFTINPSIINNYNDFLQENPDYNVKVVGFTDAKGQESDNYTLGQSRANEVKFQFLASGIAASRVISLSVGESQASIPAIANDAARQPDRKVQLNSQPSKIP